MPSIRFRYLLLGGWLTVVPFMATATQADEPRARLDVQAEAQLDVVPDRATLSARLWERTPAVARHDDDTDPDALRQARDRLEERAAALIGALEEAGVERDDINAGSLSVQPEYVPAPRRSDTDQEMLMRTRLERPFQVRVDDLERLPHLLDALTAAGVNAMDGISYDLADRDAATDEALVMALEKARHKAELMARTMNVSLGPVASISETRSPIYMPRMMAMSADARESTQQAEYRPGTIVIEAGVSVSWEIEN
ncbi:SIMPL domain-containing protein [Halomonas sp. MCCC 1A11036]|uniref:SIMPL domain-containing protein n=1 Tax=Billgrantia zhangzhouensis TaxID=2733481 RepID=A0ABS9AG00_9GAMM|nr:SIMPL domain-containing protein [Halomonas zhangzhouensis]MCE8020659.1 SIMPL domain-containing protein [Halomonas zhangzhouensis]